MVTMLISREVAGRVRRRLRTACSNWRMNVKRSINHCLTSTTLEKGG